MGRGLSYSPIAIDLSFRRSLLLTKMATLSKLEIATTFLAFTAPRSATALNYRFSSAAFSVFSERRATTVSVRTTPLLFYSPVVDSNRRRRFSSVSASASAPPQTEDSDVTTKIPPDNRIPATIITGFLGSGKVGFCCHFILF